MIGRAAFSFYPVITLVVFKDGTKLREIAESAFNGSDDLEPFIVPSSVEILG
jgi:hypothetical protein